MHMYTCICNHEYVQMRVCVHLQVRAYLHVCEVCHIKYYVRVRLKVCFIF